MRRAAPAPASSGPLRSHRQNLIAALSWTCPASPPETAFLILAPVFLSVQVQSQGRNQECEFTWVLSDKGPQARFNRTTCIPQADHTLSCASIPTSLAHLLVTGLECCGATLLRCFSEAENQTPHWLVSPDRLLGMGFLAN